MTKENGRKANRVAGTIEYLLSDRGWDTTTSAKQSTRGNWMIQIVKNETGTCEIKLFEVSKCRTAAHLKTYVCAEEGREWSPVEFIENYINF
jgi:hypothetical protein